MWGQDRMWRETAQTTGTRGKRKKFAGCEDSGTDENESCLAKVTKNGWEHRRWRAGGMKEKRGWVSRREAGILDKHGGMDAMEFLNMGVDWI